MDWCGRSPIPSFLLFRAREDSQNHHFCCFSHFVVNPCANALRITVCVILAILVNSGDSGLPELVFWPPSHPGFRHFREILHPRAIKQAYSQVVVDFRLPSRPGRHPVVRPGLTSLPPSPQRPALPCPVYPALHHTVSHRHRVACVRRCTAGWCTGRVAWVVVLCPYYPALLHLPGTPCTTLVRARCPHEAAGGPPREEDTLGSDAFLSLGKSLPRV